MSDTNDQTGEYLLAGRKIARIAGQNYSQTTVSSLVEKSARPAVEGGRGRAALECSTEVSGLSTEAMERVFAATRDKIVDEGWSSLDLDEIIEVAKLSSEEDEALRGNFKAFQLAIKLLERFHSPLFTLFSSAMSGSSSILKSVEEVGRSWINLVRCDLPLYSSFMEVTMDPPSGVDPVLMEGMLALRTQTQTIFKGLLAEGQLRGEIRKGSVDVMTITVSGCFMGLISNLALADKLAAAGIYAEDLADELILFAIKGLQA